VEDKSHPAATQPVTAPVVDDEPEVLAVLREMMMREGHRVSVCASGERATEEVSRRAFDAVFVDVCLPGLSGVEVLKVLREHLPDATFVAITGDIESELAAESLVSSALMWLSKPVSAAALTEILEGLAEDRAPG
jgi:DNA-binding NtrC family response regulator